MSTTFSTYYSLVRSRELGPEAKDWAVTDRNPENISLILKAFEQHAHTGASGILAPTTQPTLTEGVSGGSLTPGTTVGVRLAYTNAAGLETDATVEKDITLSSATGRPLTPTLGTVAATADALTGGTYVYVMTKVKGAGETEPSDALPVTIPYDTTYGVPLNFDAINTYTDGTTQLNIYRSAGLNSTFQLIAQITDIHETLYTDINVSVDQTQQPPSVSTFDMVRKVTINWSALSPFPTGATKLHVYVTQQPGVWSSSHLLSTIDLTVGSPLLTVDYLGSETLDSGYPYDATQIVSMPPKLNLATEATGGFVLTADGDFQKHQAKNIVIDNVSGAPSSPVNGQVYYDTSINNMRAYINGTWTNWGVAAGTVYTHPAEETGGHLAANIRWKTGAATPSVHDILFRFINNAGTALNTITDVYESFGPSTSTNTTSTTPVVVSGTALSVPLTAGYAVQNIELTATIQCVLTGSAGASASFYIDFGGFTVGQIMTIQLSTTTFGQSWPIMLYGIAPIASTATFTIYWYVAGGATVTLGTNNAKLYAKALV